MKLPLKFSICALLLGFAAASAPAAEAVNSDDKGASPTLELQRVFPRLNHAPPVLLREDDASSSYFLLTVTGQLFRFPNVDDPAPEQMELVVDIAPLLGTASQDQGSYSFAFDPNFAENNQIYINYASNVENRLTLSRFTLGGSPEEVLATEEVILRAEPQTGFLHYGGTVEFGPDGYLYLSTGDGNADIPAQIPNSLLGKMLRIDVATDDEETSATYTIPEDNPFVGVDGWRPEIWALGLRNPYRFSFDQATGLIYLGDPGDNDQEEINVILKGGNYGWPFKEGIRCYKESPQCDRIDLIDPIYTYDPEGRQAIIGGFVYHGEAIPELHGQYVFGDFVSGNVVAVDVNNEIPTSRTLATLTGAGIAGISTDADGEIYVHAFPTGGIFRLAPVTIDPPNLANQVGALLGTSDEGKDLNNDSAIDAADVKVAVDSQTQ